MAQSDKFPTRLPLFPRFSCNLTPVVCDRATLYNVMRRERAMLNKDEYDDRVDG